MSKFYKITYTATFTEYVVADSKQDAIDILNDMYNSAEEMLEGRDSWKVTKVTEEEYEANS